MKNFKVLSLLLVITVLFSIMCVPTAFASSQDAAKLVFSSDEAWPETVTNTTTISNDDEFWKFKFSTDSGSTYSDYTLTGGNNTYYFVAPELSGEAYDYSYIETSGNYTRVYRSANDITNPSTQGDIIGKWWMKPAGAVERRVAKVFTAPYTGKITISAKDESGIANIYSKAILDGNKLGPVLYIVKKAADGSSTELWKQVMDYSGSNGTTQLKTLSFSDIDVEVNKGEELWFIVSGEQSANGKTKFVYWNPVISYSKAAVNTVVYTHYSSDEAWPENLTSETTITNDDTSWKFKYSTDDGVNYSDFSTFGADNTYWMVAPAKNEDGTYDYTYVEASGRHTRAFWNGSGNMTTSGDAVGKWWIKLAKATNRRVAKVFTVPYTGTVTISAKDESGDAKIYSRAVKDGAQKGPVLYIIKKDADGNATELWKQIMDFPGSDGTTIQLNTCNFEEISADVKKGEEIWFVASAEQSANDRTKYVYWNPAIHYDEVGVSAPEFSSENGASLETFAAVVSAGKLNISLPVNSILNDDVNAVMCVAVYTKDGSLSDVALSETTVIPGGESISIEIADMNVKNIADGYVKVFLMDSMETLVPLNDIGTLKILSSSAQ